MGFISRELIFSLMSSKTPAKRGVSLKMTFVPLIGLWGFILVISLMLLGREVFDLGILSAILLLIDTLL